MTDAFDDARTEIEFWLDSERALALPIASDWTKSFRERVAKATRPQQREYEASRASLEALGRALRKRGWSCRRTSTTARDGRADSRYFEMQGGRYEIRISNHAHPTGYYGQAEYLIRGRVMKEYNVLGLIAWIERDYNNHYRQRK